MSIDSIKIQLLKDTATRLEDIPDSDYFGEKFKSFISNSQLKLINPTEGGSPQNFLEGFDSKKSGALELGSAVHQMILEKEKYFLSEVEKPTGKVGSIIDTLYKLMRDNPSETKEDLVKQACIENDYYSNALTDKRVNAVLEKGEEYLEFLIKRDSDPSIIVLTASMKDRLTRCLESVKANKRIVSLLTPDSDIFNIKSFNEDVITLDFKGTIPNDLVDDEIVLQLKSKIDNWSIDFDNKIITLNDLKTTSAPIQNFPGRMEKEIVSTRAKTNDKFVAGSFQKYHYYRQMAMYATLLYAHCVKEYGIDDSWRMNVNMLVVETLKPHHSQVFKVSEEWLNYGYTEFIELLQRLVFHKLRGFDALVEFSSDDTYEI